ncbi:glycosyltransferase [Bacillus massiliglaciei]|uniref:glycosyltransferase n=1 Tax=Bacillus massiliglaciei TaxID=1816693 RepID=UPI000DA63DCC|nr:glycosyltransferase [Bacillus massiliglaciei]
MPKVIIKIPFNYANVHGQKQIALTKSWIDNRIDIFIKYTLRSLKNQTNQNFIAYILYDLTSKPIIEQALLKYPPLPPHIRFVPGEKAYTEEVRKYISLDPFFYEVHLHSDDMYHQSFINQIQQYKPGSGTKILICQNGYIYDSKQHRLAKYFNFSSGFNCLIYKTEDYLSGVRYNLHGDMGAIRHPHEFLGKANYINHSHEGNVAFSFDIERKRNKVKNVWKRSSSGTKPGMTDEEIRKVSQRALFGEEITDKKEMENILKEFRG